MSAYPEPFNRGVIRPVECVKAGFASIKDDYWTVLGLAIVAILIGSVGPFGILMGPMMCGLHMCLLSRQRGHKAGFDVLFKGFDFFVPSLIATLIQMVPMIILIVPIYLSMVFLFIGVFGMGAAVAGDAPPAAGLILPIMIVVVLVLVLAIIAISMIFLFSYQLIVDRRLSGWDSIVMSAKAVMANFGGLFGLVMLNFLMSVGGLLACYVGAFLVLPIAWAAVDHAYRQIFPEIPMVGMNAPPQYAGGQPQHPWMG